MVFSFGSFLTLPVHYFHYFLFSNEICLFYFYCDHRICRTHVVPIALLLVVHHVGCNSAHFPHYSCTQCAELKQFNICTFSCEYKKNAYETISLFRIGGSNTKALFTARNACVPFWALHVQ